MQHRLVAGMAILQARDDLSAEERQALARQLGMAGMLPQLEAQQQLSRIDDPAAAWSDALGLRNRQDQTQRLQMLAEVWGRFDPEAAMTAVEDLQRADLRVQLKRQVIRHWINRDVDGAVTVRLELGDLRRFERARQLSAFAGVSPRHFESGTSVRSRLRKLESRNRASCPPAR